MDEIEGNKLCILPLQTVQSLDLRQQKDNGKELDSQNVNGADNFHEEYLNLKQNKGGNQEQSEPSSLYSKEKLIIDEKGDATKSRTEKEETKTDGEKETNQEEVKYKSIDLGDYTEGTHQGEILVL